MSKFIKVRLDTFSSFTLWVADESQTTALVQELKQCQNVTKIEHDNVTHSLNNVEVWADEWDDGECTTKISDNRFTVWIFQKWGNSPNFNRFEAESDAMKFAEAAKMADEVNLIQIENPASGTMKVMNRKTVQRWSVTQNEPPKPASDPVSPASDSQVAATD